MSFNPTVIRMAKIGSNTAMVICNEINDDIYFHVYEDRGSTHTFLAHVMPWSSEVMAIKNFDEWLEQKENAK